MSYARRYAELGIAVFPCAENAKIPASKNGFKDATTDADVIKGWRGGWNIGTPTGAQWWVLDVDPRHGGFESLEELQQKHGELPATLIARTPSGGMHYFFAADARAVNTAGKLGKGLDTRGAGGYVLVEGSKVNGAPYQFDDWDVMLDPIPEVARAPDWLTALAFDRRVATPHVQGATTEGGRNVYLTQHAGKLRRIGATQDELLSSLRVLNHSRCSPPLSDDEVRTIAGSVSRYPVEEPMPPIATVKPAPRFVSMADKRTELESLWDKGLPPGDKTGWPSVDQFYTVVPGQLTIVTGWPNSGKSEWVDALLVNLARQNWRLAFFSPENMPVELHMTKILEKADGRPFGHGPTERIERTKIGSLGDKLDRYFRFLEPVEGSLSAMDVCNTVEEWLLAHKGSKGLVIDPWNELEHWRPKNMNETEYVSQTLSEVRRWARRHSIHVWIVAHPQKIPREAGVLPIPKPDMISGSQHWWNKADACVTVFRDMNKQTQEVEIHVQKVRFKHVGRIGKTVLNYDRVTGRYFEQSGIRDYAEIRG